MTKNKRKLEWIWPGRIPRSYVTLLAAEGGIGKSGLALYLANKFAGEGQTVVYVDAESCTTHITDRMSSWNLPHINNVLFTGKALENGDVSTGAHGTIASLVRTLTEAKPDIVILDSLTALANEYDLNATNNVANFYQALEEITEIGNAAVLLIAHLRKPMQNTENELRNSNVAGSAALVNLARSVLMMQKDNQVKDLVMLKHTKCNMAKLANDLFIKIDPLNGEFISFQEQLPRRHIPAGTKMDSIRERCLVLMAEGKTKKEIATILKEELSATATEITRLWTWIRANKKVTLGV